jgi:hypothetical protein
MRDESGPYATVNAGSVGRGVSAGHAGTRVKEGTCRDRSAKPADSVGDRLAGPGDRPIGPSP